MKQLLKEFVFCPSTTGNEQEIAELYTKKAKELGLHTWTDGRGNGYASFGKPDNSKKAVLVTGHGDEVGIAVCGFTDDGFVRIVDWGQQLDPRILPGQEVVIKGKKDIPAIIGILPPHLQTAATANKVFEINHLYADTGMSLEKVKESIEVGNPVYFKKRFVELKNDRIACNAADNKLALVIMLESAKKLLKTELNVNVVYALTSQEESNQSGGRRAFAQVKPDIAIAIDVLPGEQFGSTGLPTYAPFGKSVYITKTPTSSEKIISTLKDAGSRVNVKAETVAWAHSYTESQAIWLTNLGCPVGDIGCPIRYLHQPVETIELEQPKQCALLLSEFICGLSADMKEVL
jgi:tetrahedral aminopeptidase